MLRILVCFKMVKDYEQVLSDDWKNISFQSMDFSYVREIINCFDESALELALRIKDYESEHNQEVELTAVTVSTEEDASFYKTLYAIGYDKVVRLNPLTDLSFFPLSTAEILSTFIQSQPFSYQAILFGQQAAPYDSGQVPYFVAQKIQYPSISNVIMLERKDDCFFISSQKPERLLKYCIDKPALYVIGNCKKVYLRVPTLREKLAVSKIKVPDDIYTAAPLWNNMPEQISPNISYRKPHVEKELEPTTIAQTIIHQISEVIKS